jgi:Carboxymuconolactone decarboxylase family
MSARLAPLQPPYPEAIQAAFDHIMPSGLPPLVLFTTIARDVRLFERLKNGNLLDRGHLTLRQREIVIDRVTALCRCEYEWGVHVAFFGERIGLTPEMRLSLVQGSADDPCWAPDEMVLIEACDRLHATCNLDDHLWMQLRQHCGEFGALEVIMLAGFYRTISSLANALRLPLETYAARFPEPLQGVTRNPLDNPAEGDAPMKVLQAY